MHEIINVFVNHCDTSRSLCKQIEVVIVSSSEDFVSLIMTTRLNIDGHEFKM